MFKYMKREKGFGFLWLSNDSSCTTAVHLKKTIKTDKPDLNYLPRLQ